MSPPEPREAERTAEVIGPGTGPVAIVWCRQVDNEAESPGYTTVPEDFPGHRETLDLVRIVGNLTINVADTHDYWDPEPAQALAFYPNLFVYPAFGGRYTCVGRMFLSTEDRPRLGMKTVVLETQRLLETGDFGGQLLRWHANLAGPRPPTRVAPVPDPALYHILGEAFLFHRGSTDPVIAIAADEWEPSLQVVMDLVRYMPASIVALGAFLAFPYFLPQPKTNLHELSEQLPLALALMRVPRAEASGERHDRRIASWESAPATIRDLTDGVPAIGPRGKDPTPLVLQLARDHAEARLLPIARRVDTVELPRVRHQLADEEHQSGKDRRKEIWRIGTAMESAALLLARTRGRHVQMSSETAKRAQEYLQAEPPAAQPEAELSRSAPPEGAHAGAGAVPDWLRPGPEGPPAAGAERERSVPVSTSDDPSLRPSATGPVAPAGAAPGALGPPAGAQETRPQVDAARLLETVDDRIATADRQRQVEFVRGLTELESRLDAKLRALVDAHSLQEQSEGIRAAVERRLTEVSEAQARALEANSQELLRRLGALEAKSADLADQLGPELDRRWATTVEPKFRAGVAAATGALRDELQRSISEARQEVQRVEEELRAGLAAQLDLHLREAADRESGMREALESQMESVVGSRIAESDSRRVKELRESEQRLGVLIDGRNRDLGERLSRESAEAAAKALRAADDRMAQVQGRLTSLVEGHHADTDEMSRQAVADLQVRMEAHIDQRLHEQLTQEREKTLELLARLKVEVDQSLGRAVDVNRLDLLVRERIGRTLDQLRADQGKLLDGRLASAQERLRAEQRPAVERLEAIEGELQSRGKELLRVEESIRSDLAELDRRTQVVTDRLIPIVRKTWERIGELEKREGTGATAEAQMHQMRRELTREVRRLEGELAERSTDLRDRIESALASQGKVWLTLIRQLSNLTDQRAGRFVPAPPRAPGADEIVESYLPPPGVIDTDPIEDFERDPGPSSDETEAQPPRRRHRRNSR